MKTNEKKLCRTCKYGKKPEYHKPCVVYRNDCQLYEPIEEMTPEKAIEILEECWRYSKTYKYTDAEIREAFDLAIEALKREVNQEEDNAYREKKWGKRG